MLTYVPFSESYKIRLWHKDKICKACFEKSTHLIFMASQFYDSWCSNHRASQWVPIDEGRSYIIICKDIFLKILKDKAHCSRLTNSPFVTSSVKCRFSACNCVKGLLVMVSKVAFFIVVTSSVFFFNHSASTFCVILVASNVVFRILVASNDVVFWIVVASMIVFFWL